jgi:hypothetical protein
VDEVQNDSLSDDTIGANVTKNRFHLRLPMGVKPVYFENFDLPFEQYVLDLSRWGP